MNHPLHNRRGFTLVEMLVAILLMSVGVIATLSMVSTAMNANSHANRLTTKTSLAQQMLEDLLSQQGLPVPATNAVYDLDLNASTNDLSAEGAGTYHATYTTRQSSSSMIRIDVEVSSVPDDKRPFRSTAYRCSE